MISTIPAKRMIASYTCLATTILVTATCGGESGGNSCAAGSDQGGQTGEITAGAASSVPGGDVGPGPAGAAGGGGRLGGGGGNVGAGGAPPMAEPGAVGEAQVMADGLTFASVFDLDDTTVYVANRTSRDPDTQTDQVLAVPRSGGEPYVLNGTLNVDALAVVDDEVWVMDTETDTVTHLDKLSGEWLSSEQIPLPTAITVSAGVAYLVGAAPLSVWELPPDAEANVWMADWNTDEALHFCYSVTADERGVALATNHWSAGTKQYDSTLIYAPSPVSEAVVLTRRDGLFVDVAFDADDVLFADNTVGTVERIPRSGGAPTRVLNLEYAWGLALAGEFVYATTRPDLAETSTAAMGKVVRFKRDGSGLEVLVEGLDSPSQIKVASDGVYWVNAGDAVFIEDLGVQASADASLMRLPTSVPGLP